jgi:membrane associated rhomboid family serine protease
MENYIWVAWDTLENVMKRSSMISFYLVSRMREEAVG